MPIPSLAMHDLGWFPFQQLCHTILRELVGQVEAVGDGASGHRVILTGSADFRPTATVCGTWGTDVTN